MGFTLIITAKYAHVATNSAKAGLMNAKVLPLTNYLLIININMIAISGGAEINYCHSLHFFPPLSIYEKI